MFFFSQPFKVLSTKGVIVSLELEQGLMLVVFVWYPSPGIGDRDDSIVRILTPACFSCLPWSHQHLHLSKDGSISIDMLCGQPCTEGNQHLPKAIERHEKKNIQSITEDASQKVFVGKYSHNVLWTQSTTSLSLISSYCQWSVLLNNKARSLV